MPKTCLAKVKCQYFTFQTLTIKSNFVGLCTKERGEMNYAPTIGIYIVTYHSNTWNTSALRGKQLCQHLVLLHIMKNEKNMFPLQIILDVKYLYNVVNTHFEHLMHKHDFTTLSLCAHAYIS